MNVAILTNFHEFHPGYSLTGIVFDQVLMLLRKGHNVHLFVSEKYNPQYDYRFDLIPDKYASSLVFQAVVPVGDLVDYQTMINWKPEHQKLSAETGYVLDYYFEEYKIDIAFTHDWIFTGWNLPYAGGVRYTSIRHPKVAWLHWVHSVPSVLRDWWKLDLYGEQHRIVFPNSTDSQTVCEQFRTNRRKVCVIPHIKDMRTYYEMGEETLQFIDKYPAVMHSDIVQIYPVGSDRLRAKGVHDVINIFGAWKKSGITVFLAIANAWATGRNRKQSLCEFEDIATSAGLEVGRDFVFTSRYDEKYATGIGQRLLRELQLLSNMFIYPTREESFGLVGPEAAFAGTIPVLNRSLQMMSEIFPGISSMFNFGSFHNQVNEPSFGWERYYNAVAMNMWVELKHNPMFIWKTYARQKYNSDYLYNAYYNPFMHTLCQIAETCQADPTMEKEVAEAFRRVAENDWFEKED